MEFQQNSLHSQVDGKYEIIQDHTDEDKPHYNRRLYDKNTVDNYNNWKNNGRVGPKPPTPKDELGKDHPDHYIKSSRSYSNALKNLRNLARNAKPGEKAGDIIKRWRNSYNN
jgi:hypothetical protein